MKITRRQLRKLILREVNESSEVDKLIDMATSGQSDGYPFFEDAFELAEVLGLVGELNDGVWLYIEQEMFRFTYKLEKGSWDRNDGINYNNTIFLHQKIVEKIRAHRRSQRET